VRLSSADRAHARESLARLTGESATAGPDYRLAQRIGHSYLGRARNGNCALIVPLETAPNAAGRVSFGCTLLPAERIEFVFDSEKWTQPAAILECTQPELLDTFIVLAHDVSARLERHAGAPSWIEVAAIVAEWQSLLGARERLSPEEELGLWAETWFLAQSCEPDLLVSAWQGPDDSAVDFVLGGIGAEIKASHARFSHSVSRAQAGRPLGSFEAYFVSYWVTLDPDRGATLPMIADALLERLSDPSEGLRRLLLAGYSPGDRAVYVRRFLVLEEAWFAADAIPQVRVVDPGVFNLRYRVILDDARRLDPTESARVQLHFGRASTATVESDVG
jgi:hypothetical protein